MNNNNNNAVVVDNLQHKSDIR